MAGRRGVTKGFAALVREAKALEEQARLAQAAQGVVPPAPAVMQMASSGPQGARTGVGKAKNRVGTTGQYVGAPAGVDSPQALGRIRQNYEDTALLGAGGRNWYGDSSEYILRAAPPGRQQPVADILGITSAGTGVDTNLGFTVKGLNQLAGGEPVNTGRFPKAMTPLIYEVSRGNRTHLGPKRQPFADNISVRWNPNMAQHPVHDIWDGRAWGYVGANGKPWDAGFGPAQHAFMDQQAAFLIDRMNKNRAGGFSDWDPLNLQAAAWTGAKIKAGDIDPSEAARHYGDFSRKYEAAATHEQVPGVGTGHLEGLVDMPYDVRRQYSEAANWRNEKGQDSIYASAGMLTEPTLDAVGAYTPSSGVLEINPMEVARPLVTTDDGSVRPGEKSLLDIAESSRAYVDAQNAGAWHKIVPDTQTGATDRTSLLLDVGDGPSRQQMATLSALGNQYGMFPVDGGDGTVRLINDVYSPAGEARVGKGIGPELKGPLGGLLQEFSPVRTKIETGYENYEPAWRAGEGSDTATRQFLERLDQNPTFAASIEPALRQKAAANLARDEAFAGQSGLQVRRDIQTARMILSEGGIEALRAAIGKGILPAAVLGIVLGGQGEGGPSS